MKKLYFLLTLFITTLSFGQELLVNGDFESWTDTTTPENYELIQSVEQEATEVHTGTYAVKHTGGTSKLSQTVTGVTAGTSYTISLWYKIDAGFGDGTDARIWSYWKAGSSNITANADELRGPNNAYFDANGNAWTEYTVTLTAPATADTFYFEVRTYGSAVVYWDDFSFFQEATAVPTLGVTAPNNGDNVAGPDVNVDLSVQNFMVANGTGDGHIQYTVDGGSVVMKYDTDPIMLTGLTTGEHTINLELVDNSNTPLATPVTASTTFNVYEVQSLPFTESFNYTATETLGSQTAWTNYFSGDDVLIEASSLTYPSLTNAGNSISFDGSGADPVVDFTPTTSGSVYASFMLNITALDAAATDGYFAVLRTDSGSYESRLWISPTGASTYKIGISNGAALTQISATDLNVGDTNFIVFNYDIDNNIVNAWVNPTPGGAEPVADLSEASTSTANTFSQFLIRQDSATETPFMIMDELKIATTWNDATLSTKTFEVVDNFNIYPNPTNTGSVTITTKNNTTIAVTVFDVLGKQVLSQTIQNNSLDVSNLTTGVYILKLNQEGAIATKRLIIQ
ncbi:T9SS type A sorting domain-containing protein [Olleya sp. ITB9]|uniref:T9SS type A sorting domain-containing protein n=1 Tax=Olleya sp. ITB9 TaxID=1715648 RepID=UPI0006D1E476|nr:T9SS type A sorting domain-containing protein [Olleya sp. ITB9]